MGCRELPPAQNAPYLLMRHRYGNFGSFFVLEVLNFVKFGWCKLKEISTKISIK